MGDMADDLERLWSDDDFFFAIDEPEDDNQYWSRENVEWTQKEGQPIRVQDMETKHIKNCINFVGSESGWIPIFERELNHRKRIALNKKLKKVKNFKEEIDLDKINK